MTTTRIEAAAEALEERAENDDWEWCLGDAQTALAAADAYDSANGVHRITLDDATVERAARELCGYTLSGSWPCGECKDEARAMLSAAVQEERR